MVILMDRPTSDNKTVVVDSIIIAGRGFTAGLQFDNLYCHHVRTGQ